jgi:polyhydroxyalkanoate synthase
MMDLTGEHTLPAPPAKPALPPPTPTPAPHGASAPPMPQPAASLAPVLPADLDRLLNAWRGKLTGGFSAEAIGLAFADWLSALATHPHRQSELFREALANWEAAWRDALALPSPPVQPSPVDHRFASPLWQSWPFSWWMRSFLRLQNFFEDATQGLSGVAPANRRLVSFLLRQALDPYAPSNFPHLNPEVIDATLKSGGLNFVRGYRNLLEDLAATFRGRSRLPLKVGKDIAATPGKVVFRNHLIELLQYAPTTETVHPEPVLIVPAWIMKYYILDLSPHNSLVRHLVAAGFTVFCISWRNPTAEDRDIGFDDYRRAVLAAIEAARAISGSPRLHACGYCLGGTLLSVTAAGLARSPDNPLASVTLFAAQTDFTEAGELQLFITERQLALLDDIMWQQGYLDNRQMAGTFQLLRSQDLIWSRMVREYLLGEREHPNDLMVWNADTTRMPYRMHSEYLHHFYLNNDLAEGRFTVDGHAISVRDIRGPFFVVGTETDHVAPWRSVHKIHLLNDGEITFVLTSGGHNAGIVSEPGHPRRHFRILTRRPGDPYLGPDEWLEKARLEEGSWWPSWFAWLAERSGPPGPPPPMGRPERGYAPLGPAPGHYVFQP